MINVKVNNVIALGYSESATYYNHTQLFVIYLQCSVPMQEEAWKNKELD